MKLLSSVFRVYCKYCFNINTRFFHDNSLQKGYTSVNEATIIDCLKRSSVRFTEGYTCFHVKKCFCGQKKNSTDSEVFVNKRTGFFMCKQCRVTVDWEIFSQFLNKPKNRKFDKESFEKNFVSYSANIAEWEQVVQETESLECLTDQICCDVFESFNLKPFSRSVIEELSIRISQEKDVLYFPLYVSEFVVGYKSFHINSKETVFPKVNCPGVLKSLKASDSNAAVVVATLPDFLALFSAKLPNYDVICLPYGALYLPQSSLPFFEKYDRIILWLGDKFIDITGNVAEKFHEKRCYVVKPTENQISASVAYFNKENIPKIVSEAKLCYHQYVTTFNSFRDSIMADLQNPTGVFGVPWKKFPTLNKILKGHRRGELTILTGPTGAGKTTFLSEYSLDLASQGVRTLWGSFEIKNTRLAKIMLTQFARSPLPFSTSEFNTLCDKFEQLPIFYLTFHGQQPLVKVMDAICHCSYIYDIAHVIIDNVQFMIEVYPDSTHMDRFGQQDYMIQMFRSFASQNNCHVTLVMHPKKTESVDLAINSIFGGVKASQEADNILIMQMNDPTGFNSNKHLQIAKNRFSGDLGSFPLHFYKSSLSFSEKNKLDASSKDFTEENEELIQEKNLKYL